MANESPEKRPGDKGYSSYWRKRLNHAGIGSLTGQGKPGRKVSGKSILLVLKTYGERMNNTSGECWPGQIDLARDSGTSVSTVKRVQEWASLHGWLEVLGSPIPRQRGLHVLMRPGQLPVSTDGETAGNSLSAEQATPWQSNGDSLSAEGNSLSALTDKLSLGLSTLNSHSSELCKSEAPAENEERDNAWTRARRAIDDKRAREVEENLKVVPRFD